MKIVHFSLTLIKQQSKQQWLNQGDHCTKVFCAKMRQRKIQTYVFSLHDNCGKGVEGFDKVAHLITDYYQGLLGK